MHHLTAPALLAYLRRQALHLAAAPDGALHVWPASALDAATRAAIANHKRELLTLLAPNGADVLADERRCCRDCYHLQNKGNCAMAAQGRLPGVPRWYTPAKDVPARCPTENSGCVCVLWLALPQRALLACWLSTAHHRDMPRVALSTQHRAPLTGAQRQRRHREKLRQELAALRAVTPSSPSEKDLLQQVQRLTAQLEKATRDAAALRARVEVLEAEQRTAQALRDALPAMLDKLTPAARQVARKHLEGAGLAPKPAPPTATHAQHVPSGAFLIF